jgi:hypothetical protein
MLPKTDAPHATLINNWIDINTCKKMNKLYYLIGFHCVNIILQNIQEQSRLDILEPISPIFCVQLFCTQVLCAAFLYLHFRLVLFGTRILVQKAVLKMLVK